MSHLPCVFTLLFILPSLSASLPTEDSRTSVLSILMKKLDHLEEIVSKESRQGDRGTKKKIPVESTQGEQNSWESILWDSSQGERTLKESSHRERINGEQIPRISNFGGRNFEMGISRERRNGERIAQKSSLGEKTSWESNHGDDIHKERVSRESSHRELIPWESSIGDKIPVKSSNGERIPRETSSKNVPQTPSISAQEHKDKSNPGVLLDFLRYLLQLDKITPHKVLCEVTIILADLQQVDSSTISPSCFSSPYSYNSSSPSLLEEHVSEPESTSSQRVTDDQVWQQRMKEAAAREIDTWLLDGTEKLHKSLSEKTMTYPQKGQNKEDRAGEPLKLDREKIELLKKVILTDWDTLENKEKVKAESESQEKENERRERQKREVYYTQESWITSRFSGSTHS